MFACDCGKKFKTNKGLKLHIARWCASTKPRILTCHCGKTFNHLRGQNSLRNHRKICDVFKKFRTTQRSEAAKDGFKKSLARDPEKIKMTRERSGKKISQTIMANIDERNRRAKLLGNLNKTDKFRKKASETAIKTSARKEIQESRSAALKQWRDENPDKFNEIIKKNGDRLTEWTKNHPEEHYEKCVKPLLNNWKSKPEKCLLNFCKSIVNDCRSYFLVNNIFTTKTKRRQIDVFSQSKSIIIEFDGPLHFENIFGDEDFKSKKCKDFEINSLRDKYCIIRVSYDCYFYNIENFKNDILDAIKELLLNPKNGLYLFGSKYGKDYKY